MISSAVDAQRDDFVEAVASVRRGLATHRAVRRALPLDGRLYVERPRPHLLIHRRPLHVADKVADRLVTALPPYLIIGRGTDETTLVETVSALAESLIARYDGLFVVEISEPAGNTSQKSSSRAPRPAFRIVAEDDAAYEDVIATLAAGLEGICVDGHHADLRLARTARDDVSPLAAAVMTDPALQGRCLWVRLEVRAIYRHPSRARTYPMVMDQVRSGLYVALERALQLFARRHSSVVAPEIIHPPSSRRGAGVPPVGRTQLEPMAVEVDRMLCEVGQQLDFLLNVSPSNLESAWVGFEKSQYQRSPRFEYRPLMLDPLEQKRMLFATPFEAIEDPVVARVLRRVVEEYDELLSALNLRDTPDFLRSSLRVFGAPDAELSSLARAVLEHHAERAHRGERRSVDALELRRLALARLEQYRERDPSFPVATQLRDDVAAGIMVARGTLLIRESVRVSRASAHALIAHEVDTHILTYYNGRKQPLAVFGSGVAGHETTQEGLAVLGEYLVGGLTSQRICTIAGRVVAVDGMVAGADFVEVFRLLNREHAFPPRDAFMLVTRVFRGGGLTKDALYLRGLCEVLHHVRHGGDLASLYAGKISLSQNDDFDALRERGLMRPPAIAPLFLDQSGVAERLERIREGMSVMRLCDVEPRAGEKEAS